MPCHSVPTSPAMVRTAAPKGQPVTPQRLPHYRGQHRHSASQTFYKSPVTPASPYTPLSLRSFTSSDSSSTLNTPDTSGIDSKDMSALEVVHYTSANLSGRDSSLADTAENWRSRSNGNEIDSYYNKVQAKVGKTSQNGSDRTNESGLISAEEALLAPAFLASNRQTKASYKSRPRAHSLAPAPASQVLSSPLAQRNSNRSISQQPTTPLAQRLNQAQNYNLLRTPPPNKALSRQIKMKGSLTDPVNVRSRENLINLHTPRNNANKTMPFGVNNDTSLDLFDIDENELEYDCDQDSNSNILRDLGMRSNVDAARDGSESYGYPDFSLPTLSTYPQQRNYMLPDFPSFDPFHTLSRSAIDEGQEQYLTSQRFSDTLYLPKSQNAPTHVMGLTTNGPILRAPQAFHTPYPGQAAYVPLPAPSMPNVLLPLAVVPNLDSTPPQGIPSREAPATSTAGCSVCLAKAPRTLAILMPCNHPLCSGCLTSALNIVGEKDMECAVCKGKVDDFRLVSAKGVQDSINVAQPSPRKAGDQGAHAQGESFIEPLFASPGSSVNLEAGLEGLDSAFEFQLGLENARASTPKPQEIDATSALQKEPFVEYNAVLRIDNVPWDITPVQIQQWLQQPLERVHVLLDKKGKTMSHAYVEVADANIAGKILRGEVDESDLPGTKRLAGRRPKERSSVLGKGRRARGVTVTKSSQEELMANLFPSWKGAFDRSRPSLAGLSNDRMITALEGGLIWEGELVALLHLIREPDSHFLKVPCLPFYCLTGILSKIPSDVDSRVFINSSVRDILFDVAHASLQLLVPRVQVDGSADNGYTQQLLSDLIQVTVQCKIFTPLQLNNFSETVKSLSLDLPFKCVDHSSNIQHSFPQVTHTDESAAGSTPPFAKNTRNENSLAGIAKEFGVETELVRVLLQRLAQAEH